MVVNYLEIMSDGKVKMTEPTYVHVNTGSNRRERRHGYTQTGKHFIIPAEYRELPTNVPYRKPIA